MHFEKKPPFLELMFVVVCFCFVYLWSVHLLFWEIKNVFLKGFFFSWQSSFDKGLVFFFTFVKSLVLFSINVFEHFNLKSILVFFFVLFFFRPFFIFVVLFLDNSTSWIMPIQLYHNGRYSYFPCLVLKGLLLNILLSKIHIFEMIGFLMMKCCFRFFWC